ncbi:ABC transporter ATP-binding protein [Paenibacillus alba]|uniref:ATP-binding cassette domain-containing protein n=1 Tax=Paenibacillus alba TaxID=1197127 RepID=A0ABU6FXC5_9BACL|nr:ATP-binding cassette domain-containing protein [Paenibacillus alba]MEC0226366.1 ATP-binding cassette domain-containing protein [Paenibacillus alba]NQX70740.1 ATP-binding cassette domain-containing protein [Paenibacillus alba]
MAYIEMENICKEFKVYKRNSSWTKTLKSLFIREFETKVAIQNINISIDKGELVGYIGPNGAGKSTTIKILTGILTPTSGIVRVDGRVPHENRVKNAEKMGVVFGQRSQLYWDLPMTETFQLYKKMYRIEERQFKSNVNLYVELLEMKEFMNRPIRQLSLGQKMRANLAVALLHDPEIIYLDEPTIGLDVVAKSRIRRFVRELNKEKGTTVLLTTHDMDDIEQICNRIIMIDHGQKIFDGSIGELKDLYSEGYMLIVDFAEDNVSLNDSRLRVISEEGPRKTILINTNEITIAEAISKITTGNSIVDLHIKEPNIERTIERLYENKERETVQA